MNFFAQNLRVFKTAFWPLFFLVILTSTLDQYLTLEMTAALSHPEGMQATAIIFGALSLIVGIAGPLLVTIVSLYGVQKAFNRTDSLPGFFSQNWQQLFIENIRAWGKVLAWGLLLIIPGLIKYLQYSFVSYVVTGSQRYNAGQVDALQESTQIFKRHWLKTLLILFVFGIFIPLVLTTLFDAHRLIWKTPLTSLLLSAINTYFTILATHLLFNIFNSEDQKHESYI